MARDKPLVLVLGATGRTGKSIIQGLRKSDNFRIAALVRAESASKPAAEELRSSGVEIRIGDITDSLDKLKQNLGGVNTLISVVSPWVLDAQKTAFLAAKEVGVQRVIPCDWATPGAKGLRTLNDTKLAIHEYIETLGIGHTFIDVGWWMQLYLPLPIRSAVPQPLKALTHSVYGSGDVPNLLTDLGHIGTYVARIVADPRTLNRSVIIWEDEVSKNKAYDIGERLDSDGDKLKAQRIPVSAAELQKAIADAKAAVAKDPNNVSEATHMQLGVSEYMYSMHILGENTLENAKRLGYLDVRELYPDVPAHSLEDYAQEFYGYDDPGRVWG